MGSLSSFWKTGFALSLIFFLTASAHAGDVITVGKGVGYDFSHIQDAIDFALPGATVQVYSGSYGENLTLSRDITLTGVVDANGNRPVINPNYGQAVIVANGLTFEFSGFEVCNAQGGIYSPGRGASNVTALVYNNVFHDLDAEDGIYWQDDYAGGEAIYLGGTILVCNNFFYNNKGLAEHDHSCTVRLRSDYGNNVFVNNTLVNNTNAKATVYANSPYATIYNNIIVGEQEGFGVAQWSPRGDWEPDIQFNLIYDCNSGECDDTVTLGETIRLDPEFLDELANDFRISMTSPAIDAGTDTGALGVLEDFFGTLRPYDFPGLDPNGPLPDYDIGAHEVVPEPASICLLAAGFGILTGRRFRWRRHSSNA